MDYAATLTVILALQPAKVSTASPVDKLSCLITEDALNNVQKSGLVKMEFVSNALLTVIPVLALRINNV